MLYYFESDPGIHVFKLQPPLDFDMLHDTLSTTLEDATAAGKPNIPLLYDCRALNLLDYEADAFRRLAWRRSQFPPSSFGNLMGMVVRDEGSFGMIRLYATYAEIYGVRQQDDCILSTELSDVMDVFDTRIGLPDCARDRISAWLDGHTLIAS